MTSQPAAGLPPAHKRVLPAFLVFEIVGTLLVVGGIVAFLMAPPGANAKSALIAPGIAGGLILLCGVLTFAGAGRTLSRIAAHAGMVLCLLITLAFAAQLPRVQAGITAHRSTSAIFAERVAAGQEQDSPEARRAFLENANVPVTDRTYVRNTVAVLAVVAAAGFLALLKVRPRPIDAGASATTGGAA